MHTEVLHVRLGDHASDGVRDAPDAELQGAAAGHIGEDVGCDLSVDIGCSRALHRRNRNLRLHNIIHIPNVDVVIGKARNRGHAWVYFEDDMLRCVQDLLHGAVGEAVGEVPVFVHGRHRDHRDVHRGISLAVIASVVPEQHGNVIGPSLVDVFPVQAGAVPEVVGEGAVGIVLYGLHRDHGDGVADLHVMQFPAAPRQRRIQRLGEGTGLAVVHPVPVLHNPDRFVRRAELLCIHGLIVHLCPPMQLLLFIVNTFDFCGLRN